MEISDSLQKSIKLPLIRLFFLNCGMKTIKIESSFFKNETKIIYASEEVFKALHLPLKYLTLSLHYDRFANTINLGPVICLLTDYVSGQDEIHFGNMDDYCKEMANYSKEKGALFYVSTLPLLNDDQMKGFYLAENVWTIADMPFPNVIYNRIRSRRLEGSKNFLNLMETLTMNNIPIFNRRYLNKWEIYKIFASNHSLLPYVPKTALLTKKAELQIFLHDFKDVFIKPIHGSHGRGIMRLKQNENGFEVRFSHSNEPALFSSFDEMYEKLLPYLKKEQHIIQETIDLVSYDQRCLDFRLLCHKIDQQQWKVTSSVARLSAKDQFVSNLAKGGEQCNLKKMLSECFDRKTCFHLYQILHEISLEIVNTICLEVEGEYGEFGIDIGISKDGKPWILEVNTKPSKRNDISESKTIRPSAKAIVHYCFSLSGYEI